MWYPEGQPIQQELSGLRTHTGGRMLAMLLLTSTLHLQLPQILSFGIVGAIPAAVWLAGTTKNRGPRASSSQ